MVLYKSIQITITFRQHILNKSMSSFLSQEKKMNTKVLATIAITTIMVIVSSVTAMGIQQSDAKSCNPHGCKGSFHWYTKEGHHHCFKGSDGCKFFDYSGYNSGGHKETY